MRAVMLIALGFFIGLVATVMVLAALRQETSFHQGLMSVIAHHHGALRRMAEPGQCAEERIPAHLGMLRLAGDDLEAAFLPTFNDPRFIRYAADYRSEVDAALRVDAIDCASVAEFSARIGDRCAACHRDFR